MYKYILFIIIILASVRGAIIYHFQIDPQSIYYLSSILLVSVSMHSYVEMRKDRYYEDLFILKKYISYNMIIMSFYFITISIYENAIQFGVIYQYAIFSLVFTLMKYDDRFLNQMIFIITIFTLYGVLEFYLIGLSPDGYYELIRIKETLRPSSDSISKIGTSLQSFGFQGSHHDAANILAITYTFYVSKAIKSNKGFRYLQFIFALVIMLILFLTGSASNIVVALLTSAYYLLIWAKSKGKNIIITIIIIMLLVLLFEKVETIIFFTNKFVDQNTLEQRGILNSLSINSVFNSFHSIIFGYGYAFNVPLRYSELAFVKMLIAYGIIPFIITMFILISPFYYLFKFKKKVLRNSFYTHNQRMTTHISKNQDTNIMIQQLYYSTLPLICGILTLLHYGSLFRITSIGLYCIIMALYYKEYIGYLSLMEKNNYVNKVL